MIQPKYNIGDVVFRGTVSSRRVVLPCPDCQGTHKWKAQSLVEEFEIECPRCSTYSTRLPTLIDVTFVPRTERLTIGSVRFDSADRNEPFSYMCEETGVGSGSVYRESDLHDSEETALRVAQFKANEQITEHAAKPAVVKFREISGYSFSSALAKIAEDKARDYKFKLQDAHQILFDDSRSDEETLKDLRELLETVDG